MTEMANATLIQLVHHQVHLMETLMYVGYLLENLAQVV
jgi:hypothetical protein